LKGFTLCSIVSAQQTISVTFPVLVVDDDYSLRISMYAVFEAIFDKYRKVIYSEPVHHISTVYCKTEVSRFLAAVI